VRDGSVILYIYEVAVLDEVWLAEEQRSTNV